MVHGEQDYLGPALVKDTLLADLDALVPLAPMHHPHNLAAIRFGAVSVPNLPQLDCFDTSVHQTQDKLAKLLPFPIR